MAKARRKTKRRPATKRRTVKRRKRTVKASGSHEYSLAEQMGVSPISVMHGLKRAKLALRKK